MTSEEVYRIWAPSESVWSPWVAPVAFIELECDGRSLPEFSAAGIHLPGLSEPGTACVIDLPGWQSVQLATALARHSGYRPVPLFNASPGPSSSEFSISDAPKRRTSVVDMSALLDALCWATDIMRGVSLQPSAPPAFLVDSKRLSGVPEEKMFDNRWIVFPQDFPSAKFLQSQGISRVLLVQSDSRPPQDDLAHVLLRWQQSGIRIIASTNESGAAFSDITVNKPRGFKSAWYRALAMLGLRRSSAGGFGSYIPESSSSG
jgi:hypothetical protein